MASSSQNLGIIKQEFQNSASNIESARFLKRVLQKAEEEEGKSTTQLLPPTERAFNYTGLDKRVFPHASTDIQITEVKEIKRSLIHEHLLSFYMNPTNAWHKDVVPTTRNLFKSLFGKIPIYVDIRTFRKYLASMGYIWLKIDKGYIVMERPEVTFERYYYLKDIVRYRDENRVIFYVDETVFTTDKNYYTVRKYNSLMKTADKAGIEISHSGLIKSIYAVSKIGVHALKHIDAFNSSTFEYWMLNELLPTLPEKSVVVIKPEEHHEYVLKKPTLYSLKSDMINWLTHNNVPFDNDMSKCDLLDLIDTYTSETDDNDKVENILKLHGHTLLRLPSSIEEITTAQHLFEFIKLNAQYMCIIHGEILSKICQCLNPMRLEEYDENIAAAEKKFFEIDLKMDDVFDDAIKSMKSINIKDMEDSEVPLSDSD